MFNGDLELSHPEPKFSVNDVSTVILTGKQTQTSKDVSIIDEVVRDLNTNNTAHEINIMATKDYKLYGIDVRLKPYPGLTFPFLIVSRGQHMYFETNMQKNTFVNIDGTALKQWVLLSQ